MRKKAFDCVQMQHRGAARVQAQLAGLSEEERAAWWVARYQALVERQERLRRVAATGADVGESLFGEEARSLRRESTPQKAFDCVEMKRQGAAWVHEQLAGMSLDEQLAWWQARAEELRERQARLRREATARTEANPPPAQS